MNNDSDWELTIENIFSLKPEYSKKIVLPRLVAPCGKGHPRGRTLVQSLPLLRDCTGTSVGATALKISYKFTGDR